MNDRDAIGCMLKQVEWQFNVFHHELISSIFATFQWESLEAHLTLLGKNLQTLYQHANLSLYGRLIYLMYCLG